MKVLGRLEKSIGFWYLFAICGVFFILRFPSLFEPYWYGDEGVYQAVALAIKNGRLLYQGIWDNKPPLLYMVYGLFDSDQFGVKLASLIFGLLSIFVFYKLCKKIFVSQKIALYSTAFFALLFGSPILEGNIANAENFMILPILTSALIILSLRENDTIKTQNRNILIVFFSGILLGLAFLFKIVAMFDFAAFFIFLALFADEKFLTHIKNKRYQAYEVKKVFSYFLGFIIPGVLTTGFFIAKGAFKEFINATFFSNIGYVGYGNKLIIPQGLLILKLVLLFGLIAFLFTKRNSFSKAIIFVWLWFAFSLFNAFFSQRPYTHYLLVLLPSFSILLGLVFAEKKFRKISVAFVLLSLLLISKNFGVYGKPLTYYGNFLSFITSGKSVSEYQRFFDNITPVDYELASFIKGTTKDSDTIFTWGNNAQLYKLTNKLPPGRFTVAYHITGSKDGIKETTKDLDFKKPKLIIIMPYMNFYPFNLSNYSQRIIIDKTLIYERIL
ncbi:MAG TPA: glycosyltransferase family 39 protein [Patescibacteria group bacterium]|nr:glycosyltransferase family 39 protein [Patescibacteria group bacterium]